MGGGVPIGRIIEIFGPESSGKSTLCLEIIAQFQKQGKIVGYIDT
jgi:recombination protein RecA